MKRTILLSFILLLAPITVSAVESLESGWASPPREARLRAYWWWLNGCVTKEAITRDLEEMKAKGYGGALICDADGSAQDGSQRTLPSPTGAPFSRPPNFAQHKRTDPANVLPGYDYDVITAEALLTRASVQDGRIVLPDSTVPSPGGTGGSGSGWLPGRW